MGFYRSDWQQAIPEIGNSNDSEFQQIISNPALIILNNLAYCANVISFIKVYIFVEENKYWVCGVGSEIEIDSIY